MSKSKPLRLYPAEALTPENVRLMLVAAADRGARWGFQLVGLRRKAEISEALRERRKQEGADAKAVVEQG